MDKSFIKAQNGNLVLFIMYIKQPGVMAAKCQKLPQSIKNYLRCRTFICINILNAIALNLFRI